MLDLLRALIGEVPAGLEFFGILLRFSSGSGWVVCGGVCCASAD